MNGRIFARVALGASLLMTAGVSTPAQAYKVWVEYQGQTTVTGPESVAAKLMVLIEPSDSPTPVIRFRADCDCVEGVCTDPCPPWQLGNMCVSFYYSPYDWTLSGVGMFAASPLSFDPCAGMTCSCLAGAYVTTQITTPLGTGTYEVATVPVSRTWQELNCQLIEHTSATVQVACDDPACTGGGVFELLAGPVSARLSTWGMVKSRYGTE